MRVSSNKILRVLATAWIIFSAVEPYAGAVPAGEQQVFSNDNIDAVFNGPTTATTFRTDQPWVITYVMTYHYNGGMGQSPGTLALKHEDGTMYGPWQTSGRSGRVDQPNLYWECWPGIVIKPGVYTVIDSHPASWAWNDKSGGGITIIKGQPSAPAVSRQGSVWKIVWESLPGGWTVSSGDLLADRSNLIAGAGERELVDNSGFSDNLYFRFAAEPLPRYGVHAIVEVSPAREQDLSTPEKVTAHFTDDEGLMTPGYQGAREVRFQGHRAIRYDVGFPKSTQKEWGYFVEIDPERNLWSAVMCHVSAVYSGSRDEGPSKEEQISKRSEMEQTVEQLLEEHIRITS